MQSMLAKLSPVPLFFYSAKAFFYFLQRLFIYDDPV